MIHVFVSLTDSFGQVNVRLVCTKADSEQEFYALEGTTLFADRLALVNLSFAVQNLRFDEAGEYMMQLFCDDILVTQRRILVYQGEE